MPTAPAAYVHSVSRLETRARAYLARERRAPRQRRAIVLDIDGTTLLTYRARAVTVRAGRLPPVPGMPRLVDWAARHGYAVFWITARSPVLRSATAHNLARAGYRPTADRAHLYPVGGTGAPSACRPHCTIARAKALTRARIAALGYTIIADFGNEPSDLAGGHTGRRFLLPNPTSGRPRTQPRRR